MLEKIINSKNFDDFFGTLSEKEREYFCMTYYNLLRTLSESKVTYMTKNAIVMEIIKSVFFLESNEYWNNLSVIKEMEISENISSFFSIEPKIIDRYIKKLKYQKIKSKEELRVYMERLLFLSQDNYELVLEKRKIRYFINDDYAREQVERFLKKNGIIHDSSFNKSIIEVGQDSFVFLMENFLSKENMSEIQKMIRDENIKENLKKIYESFFEIIKERSILTIGKSIFDLMKIVITTPKK